MNSTVSVSMDRQSWLFQRLRWRLLNNSSRQLFGKSRIRLISIVLCSLMVAGAVGGASWEGFNLMAINRIPFAGGIIGILFDFLFLSLSVMLFFSGGIIIYGSLFSSPETAFLLSMPARADRIFAYKFQTATAFSSWAFVLLGCPILFAYGLVYSVSWHFYVILPVVLLGFVLLPGSLGSIACLLLVSLLPQRRKQALSILALLFLLFVGWRVVVIAVAARESLNSGNRDSLQNLFVQFEFARSPFAPSHWMTQSLQAAARGDLASAAMPVALIWSNGLFAYLLAAVSARYLYRHGYNRIATGTDLRKRYGGHWLDQAAMSILRFLDKPTRLLFIKDFRTFRRDPLQWAQILIFSGLVLLYILNSRQFYREDFPERFRQGISLMNLTAMAMLMCAFMGRFIYPLISLEGKKFWVLGLLPISRDRLIWGKFIFAAAGAITIAEVMTLISDLILAMNGIAILIHLLTIAVLALGLSGLSVGLGAWLANFRETDPSKIAVGMGGTLNLVAGLLFLVLTIALMAGPYHSILMFRDDLPEKFIPAIIGGIMMGLALGVCTVLIPIRIGIRTLRKMEF
jgi:ABC-2 type transport system permease protein